MTQRKKMQILIILGAALLALMFASAGASSLQLRPGTPFPLGGTPTPVNLGGNLVAPASDTALLLLRGVLALAIVLIPLAILINLLTPEGRQRLAAYAILLVGLLLLGDALARRPKVLTAPPSATAAYPAPGAAPLSTQPAEVFIAHPPTWMYLLSGVGIALILTGVIAIILLVLAARKRLPAPPLLELAGEAENAAEALQEGGNFRDIVVRCYYQMGLAIRTARGIEREDSMTASEFESSLQELGFPMRPVHALTRLFEKVRYGSQPADEDGKRQAIESLNAIAAFCREQKGAG